MAEHTCAKCMEGRHVRCQAKGRCPCPTCGGRTPTGRPRNRRTTQRAVHTPEGGWTAGTTQIRPPRPPRPRGHGPTGGGGPKPMTPEEEADIRAAVLQLVEGIARRTGRGHLIEREATPSS